MTKEKSVSTKASGTRQGFAVARLREMIISGELVPGQRLTEVGLSETLKVSRTPVRHAIAILVQERLIEGTAGGFLVRAVKLDEVMEAAELTSMLESVAARNLAERGASRSLIRELNLVCAVGATIIDKGFLLEADIEDFARMNGRFHALIQDGARAPLLTDLLQRIRTIAVLEPGNMPLSTNDFPKLFRYWAHGQYQHEALVRAIEGRDSPRAMAVSREHAELQREVLEAYTMAPSIAH